MKDKSFAIQNGVFEPFKANQDNLKIETYGSTITIKYKGETVGFIFIKETKEDVKKK